MSPSQRFTSVALFIFAGLLSACQPIAASPSAVPTQPRRTAPALGPTSTATRAATPDGAATTPTPSLAPVPTPSENDWQRGPSDAPVTLVVYMDFQCTPCNTAAKAIDDTYARHPNDVRQVYRPFPLFQLEDKTQLAARLVEGAGRQGKFWPMHDLLVDRFAEWRDLTPEAFLTWAVDQADHLGLDTSALRQAVSDAELSEQIAQRYAEAQASGIPGAPFVLLNGRPFLLASDTTQLEAAVRLGILQTQQSETYPKVDVEPGTDYLAMLHTNLGEIQIQLFADTAPLAVNSFIHLAHEGWYDGTGAYQVVPDQWVGLGDPTWTGLGDAGYHYPLETDPSRTFHRAGTVGVIPTGPEINGSRLFVGLVPLPEYDETHTVLGQVTQGLDILASLSARQPLEDLLTPPELTIRSIEIVAQ